MSQVDLLPCVDTLSLQSVSPAAMTLPPASKTPDMSQVDLLPCVSQSVLPAAVTLPPEMESFKSPGMPALALTDTPSVSQEAFIEPSKEQINQILAQVEFYFCDANIQKDRFILKHIRSNQEGWVSVGLITSFRKMQKFNVSSQQVAFALHQSTKLAVSDDGTKVRRIDPLPAWDDTVYSKSILISDFQDNQQLSIAALISCFEKVSCPVALVRILQPGKPLPTDLRRFSTSHPCLTQQICAVVEFASIKAAHKAIATCAESASLSFTVVLLGTNPSSRASAKSPGGGRNDPPSRRKEDKSPGVGSDSGKKKSAGRPSPPTPPVNTRAELLRLSVPNSRASSLSGSPKGGRKNADKSSPVNRSPASSPRPLSRQLYNRGNNPTSVLEPNTTPRVVHIRQPLGPDSATPGFQQRPRQLEEGTATVEVESSTAPGDLLLVPAATVEVESPTAPGDLLVPAATVEVESSTAPTDLLEPASTIKVESSTAPCDFLVPAATVEVESSTAPGDLVVPAATVEVESSTAPGDLLQEPAVETVSV